MADPSRLDVNDPVAIKNLVKWKKELTNQWFKELKIQQAYRKMEGVCILWKKVFLSFLLSFFQLYAQTGKHVTDSSLRDSKERANEIQRQLTVINDVIFASDTS